MNEITIKSWKHLLDVNEHLDVGTIADPAYAFRGQSNSDWSLEPSLLREIRRSGLSETAVMSFERNALKLFMSGAHARFPGAETELAWLFIMRHHGAPTRVLDWTRSFWVAAYFAAAGDLEVSGALWVVHTRTVMTGPSGFFREVSKPTVEWSYGRTGDEIAFVSSNRKTDRENAQQGLFSVSRAIVDHRGPIESRCEKGDSEKTLFAKIVIPSSLKVEILHKLRSMNIGGSSLFPGLDGLGVSSRELLWSMSRDRSNCVDDGS